MTTVASKARTAFTPSSSTAISPWTAWVRASTQACAAQRNSPAWEPRPSFSPLNCSDSFQVSPTLARHRPFGRRSSTNSAKRSRSLSGLGGDIALLGGQRPCQSTSCGLESDLQLIALLSGWTDHVHLELRVPALVGVHPDDEELTVGHLDPQLPPVGSHDRAAQRVSPHGREGLGDATQILERYRAHG